MSIVAPMALPEIDLARIRRWADAHTDAMSGDASDVVRYELDVEPRSVTILECRPPWREDFGPEWTRIPIARLRYTKARKEWAIYWRDRHSRIHLYDVVEPTPNVESLLAEIDADPTCIFWG
jgi:hypothetical protein